MFVSLYRQLTYGQYAGFLEDLPLVMEDSLSDAELWGMYEGGDAPTGLFTAGEVSDGYPCPELEVTVRQLARDPRNAKARLCLGDFYRLNGFDNFYLDYATPEGELGSTHGFRGERNHRHGFYTDIIAQRNAPRAEKAYALYRAIRCYAPANTNTCGGEGVPENVRAAWFRQLKNDYANTRWARDLEYYW